MIKILTSVFVAVMLCSCASTTTYNVGPDGKPSKAFQTYADTYGPTTITTNSRGTVIKVEEFTTTNFPMMKVAVTNSKGNPILDKNGNAIFNEVPLVPGIRHSEPTMALFRGLSLFTRSVSNLAGTIISGMFGIEVAKAGVVGAQTVAVP